MALVFVNTKKSYFGNFIYTKEQDGSTPILHTGDISIPATSIIKEDRGLTFRIKKSDCLGLHAQVMDMEERVSMLIRSLSDDVLSTLPDTIRSTISMERVDMDWDCLRSNYFTSEAYPEPTMYLKSTGFTMMMNDQGSQLLPSQLGDGFYRFRIKADTVYLGRHKNPIQVANLQLRITDLRFTKAQIATNEEIDALINDVMDTQTMEPTAPSMPTTEPTLAPPPSPLLPTPLLPMPTRVPLVGLTASAVNIRNKPKKTVKKQ